MPKEILDLAPVDLQLMAEITFENNATVTDEKGMIRVLSGLSGNNPSLVMADHDNTLHATGGANALQDWIDFLTLSDSLPSQSTTTGYRRIR